MILAWADARVEAFTLFGIPSDRQAETSLETTAQQIAGGAISSVQGQLALMETRTRRFLGPDDGHVQREINNAMRLAVKESKLRLRRQQINADNPIRTDRVEGQSDFYKAELIRSGVRRCDPRFWSRFNYEKTSKSSDFCDFLVNNFVSLTVPAQRTNRDVVELIARGSYISIESLSDALSQPLFTRGQAISGFAGDEFDQIARNYNGMQWWISDAGLNMVIVGPATPNPPMPTFHELMGRLDPAPVASRKRLRRGKTDATVQRIKRKVRELRKEGLGYRSICDKLMNEDRPPRAAWRDCSWPSAYKKHTSAVTKWLSEACSNDR